MGSWQDVRGRDAKQGGEREQQQQEESGDRHRPGQTNHQQETEVRARQPPNKAVSGPDSGAYLVTGFGEPCSRETSRPYRVPGRLPRQAQEGVRNRPFMIPEVTLISKPTFNIKLKNCGNIFLQNYF